MTLERMWAGWRAAYVGGAARDEHPEGCLICRLADEADDDALVLERTDHTFTLMNAYPYTSGHVMVAPRRHGGSLSDLEPGEAAALMHAAQRAAAAIEAAYMPDGLNLGLNIGRAGGAGVPGHLHLHALPRWAADTNFMTSVAEARVLPEDLRTSWERLRAVWPC